MIGRFPKKERVKILRAAKKQQSTVTQRKEPVTKISGEVTSNPKVRI